ncbi:MAG: holo-ACP synthase [Anaerolineaceae bacterium]|nr:holo-ACP synthase [Anaerolineaceae bacterium]
MILRTGVDLIEINRLADLNPKIRARFLQRVYTPAELASSGTSNASLAGRFAAKEAVAKALGTGIGPVRWQEIEICDGPQSEPLLRLHSAAQEIATQLGLHTWSISISHTATHAVAMAVALGEDTDVKAGQR